jgi:hypothetical protein
MAYSEIVGVHRPLQAAGQEEDFDDAEMAFTIAPTCGATPKKRADRLDE